jgi:oligopeptidase A
VALQSGSRTLPDAEGRDAGTLGFMVLANPLLHARLPLPFDEVRAEHIEPAIDALLVRADVALEAISASPVRTYATCLFALDGATADLEYAAGIASHLESVVGTPALRQALESVTPKLSAFFSKILLSEPLFQALREYESTEEARGLAPSQQRFLKKTLADFRRNGAELGQAGKARLAEIDVALSSLTLQFAQNVVDATSSFEWLVEEADASRLDGLPEGAKLAAKKSAEEKGKSGYRFTLQAPSYGPMLTFCKDRELRELLYRAQSTRASGHGPGAAACDNREIIRKVLALRKEKASLLGFAHFADLAIDDRMAKSGAAALSFVTMLRDRLLSAFERENVELASFAKQNGHVGSLEPWDVPYWAETQRRALFDFDEETLRPYFPLDRVQRGLFDVATNLYGITIEREPNVCVWHEDVTFFRVLDADGTRIGGFYLDLFPRETKRDGAWMAGMVDRLKGTPHESENIAMIVGNVTPPQGPGAPALLNHREVETLFHEFGHMLHHVLSDVPIRALAGTRVVSDFVELPSMIMENWCWERDALDLFARHFESGAPIPEEVKARMLSARTYRAANALMRQLGFSTVDLLLHTTYDPNGTTDVLSFARENFQRFSPAPLPNDYAMLASFSHLFGSAYGYAAGYYSYQWSSMLEADAFKRFAEHGILNPSVGDSFRRTILARGDTEDPSDLFRTFLGRDPDVGALLTRLGIVHP